MIFSRMDLSFPYRILNAFFSLLTSFLYIETIIQVFYFKIILNIDLFYIFIF